MSNPIKGSLIQLIPSIKVETPHRPSPQQKSSPQVNSVMVKGEVMDDLLVKKKGVF